jgi:pimeloyl-ACP methyl ester carboxylesterase
MSTRRHGNTGTRPVSRNGRGPRGAPAGRPALRGRRGAQIIRSHERTPANQALYRAAVHDVPYPVQAVWASEDPTMTLAVYGEKARAAAGLPSLHIVPGKHFPQEDQAPAIARKIAELAHRAGPGWAAAVSP